MNSKEINERMQELKQYPGRFRVEQDIIALYALVESWQPENTMYYLAAKLSTIQTIAEQGGPDALTLIATIAREAYEGTLARDSHATHVKSIEGFKEALTPKSG